MKPSQAILLTLALAIFGSLLRFQTGTITVSLLHVIVVISAIWAAVDSSKLNLRRYQSGISCSPPVLFILMLLLWAIAFPWYLSTRHKIQTGCGMLKESGANV